MSTVAIAFVTKSKVVRNNVIFLILVLIFELINYFLSLVSMKFRCKGIVYFNNPPPLSLLFQIHIYTLKEFSQLMKKHEKRLSSSMTKRAMILDFNFSSSHETSIGLIHKKT